MADNRTLQVLRANTLDILYEGQHASYREALEQALKDNVPLDGLNAKGRSLRRANLDGIRLTGGNFKNCDLSGANLSEASLIDCNFDEAKLFDTCFCYSDFTGCHFVNACFGLTDFSEAVIQGCNFSGTSLFSTNLNRTHLFKNNVFLHENTALKMSSPPIAIQGMKNIVTIFDTGILVGNEIFLRNLEIKVNNSR